MRQKTREKDIDSQREREIGGRWSETSRERDDDDRLCSSVLSVWLPWHAGLLSVNIHCPQPSMRGAKRKEGHRFTHTALFLPTATVIVTWPNHTYTTHCYPMSTPLCNLMFPMDCQDRNEKFYLFSML